MSVRLSWVHLMVPGVLLFFLSPQVHASPQGEAPEVAQATPPLEQARTFEQPLSELPELAIRLKPLTKDELEVELAGWLGLLKDKQAELSEIELSSRAREAAGEDTDAQLVEFTSLVLEKTALTERVRAVEQAFAAKGGDVTDAKHYIDAVSGVEADLTDPKQLWLLASNWLSSKEGGQRFGLNLLKFLGILLVFRILSNVLKRITARAMNRLVHSNELLEAFFTRAVKNGVMLIGVLIGVSTLGVNIGPLLAALGAAGFVVGFALQGTLSNFASGLMILFYQPYDIGDFISVGGVMGKVEAMNLVSTTIRTGDNQKIIMPNNSIWGDTITNVTGTPTRRVDLVFGVGYDDDLAKAESLLSDIIADHPKVLDNPEPTVRVHELADSSVNFIVRPWTKTDDYWDVYWDITRTVKDRFDQQGLSIPYPQRDVHVHGAPVLSS